jgi:hypothetical protein
MTMSDLGRCDGCGGPGPLQRFVDGDWVLDVCLGCFRKYTREAKERGRKPRTSGEPLQPGGHMKPEQVGCVTLPVLIALGVIILSVVMLALGA